MDDASGHSRPQQDSDQLRHTLSVRDVAGHLSEAGVPRSDRQIKRYCETGFLDATKVPGPTGEQWFVAPAALPKLIGDLQQWQMQRAGSGGSRPAMSGTVRPDNARNDNEDTAGSGRPQQAVSDHVLPEKAGAGESDVSGYVTQLEKRIDEKDEIIVLLKGQMVTKDKQLADFSERFISLSDRFADTQRLMGAMQRMLAPLLGQADPFTNPENRGANDAPSPPSNGDVR